MIPNWHGIPTHDLHNYTKYQNEDTCQQYDFHMMAGSNKGSDIGCSQ